jgi:arylsulfatase A-like enzyme/Tfp pilus assembly protein PilF
MPAVDRRESRVRIVDASSAIEKRRKTTVGDFVCISFPFLAVNCFFEALIRFLLLMKPSLSGFALLVLAGCAGRGPGAPAARPNVLLVTIDTLRADRLGCYGWKGAATPTLDALAARGARFETAVAHVPLTGPSHASILTGRNPPGHGFRDNGGYVLPASAKTAAEEFKAAGYRTAAFVSGFPLDRRFGFGRGFDVYDDHLPKGNDPRRAPYLERFADATTEAALRFAAAPSDRPFFLWVHYYDPHAPYEPPGELSQRFAGEAAYDGEIAFVDQQLARLLPALPQQRTLTLVTADHGESLGEHGEGTHGLFVYDATLRVPWILTGPAVTAGGVPKTVARGIDVLPTLLDFAGLGTRPEIEGRSLRPAVEGKEMSDAPAYVESLYPEREFGWAPLFGWRTATVKLIEAPRPELYDLQADPAETKNAFAQHAATVEELRGKLAAAIARTGPSATAELDAETAQRLAALGYLGGGRGGASRAPASQRRDPKDGVRLMPQLNRGMSLARTEPERAIRELSAVISEDPGLLMARRTRAVAYAAAGKHEQAIAELRRIEKEGGLSAEDAIVLGDNLRFSGRLKEAEAVLADTAKKNPAFVQPWLSLAEVHVKEKRLDEAATSFSRALELAPDHIEALRGAGDVALLQEKVVEAAARYTRILEVDPGDAGAMTKLAVVKMREQRPDEAITLLQRAVAREPKNGEALLYLAGALASSGKPAEALPYFERALAVGPRSSMALNGLALTKLALGDRAGAAQAFRESLAKDPRQPDVQRSLAELLAQR